MFKQHSLAVFKKFPAIVTEAGEKVTILFNGTDGQRHEAKVRPKDIVLLHEGPAKLEDMNAPLGEGDIHGAWELLLNEVDDNTKTFTLKELAELAWGEFTPRTAWESFTVLDDGLYFSGEAASLAPKSAADVEAEQRRRDGKKREAAEREAFIASLRSCLAGGKPLFANGTEGDAGTKGDDGASATDGAAARGLADVEALATGAAEKSRTLRELGLTESPEEAHELLLKIGYWTAFDNPWPSRHGCNARSAAAVPGPAPDEDRVDLTHLAAFAIDSAWSGDPDDAVSLEPAPDGPGFAVWVHVADPAAAVTPGSPADVEARGRGATLYLPEGASRMLAAETTDRFALGLDPDSPSPALSFKMTLNADLSIANTEICRSLVKVTRLTYEAADEMINHKPHEPHEQKQEADVLAALQTWACGNEKRRVSTGAVLIDFPEVHISVDRAAKTVGIRPVPAAKSAAMVRECMVLAGEGAAAWALERRLPFPFVGQEEGGEFPKEILPGLAGSCQIRRLMRPRQLSTKPRVHWGLGLDQYTQVTSPLRRYTDLIAHQQIRAVLRGEAPVGEEELAARIAAADAASLAAVKAERASRAHWTAVYLLDKAGSEWDAVVLEKKGPSQRLVTIPALGLETVVSVHGSGAAPNESVRLRLASVSLPSQRIAFTPL